MSKKLFFIPLHLKRNSKTITNKIFFYYYGEKINEISRQEVLWRLWRHCKLLRHRPYHNPCNICCIDPFFCSIPRNNSVLRSCCRDAVRKLSAEKKNSYY